VGFPLAPGATIGILGGGQLGRMLALAAARLGFDVAILTPEPDDPALRVAAHRIVSPYEDHEALVKLAELSDVITYEFENVPVLAAEMLIAHGAAVAPKAEALAVAQDRLVEKSFLNAAGAATVGFHPVHDVADLKQALADLGGRVLLKTRRGGYDGKGQTWVEGIDDAEAAFARLDGRSSIAEAPADFVRELAVIAARGRDGAIACYPLTQSWHQDGILRRTVSPAPDSDGLAPRARAMAEHVLNALGYVGVLGLELFETRDGTLLANEFAPRVHNTGHWTADACAVDQFEQHIRAVAGWPLGPTEPLAPAEMINLIGADVDAWADLAADPAARVWLYGKDEARAGRKMGHVTRLSVG
jgi:5-(carboxyamino)imidazole ribonucleotide synthase